jgi:hypothetical protein
MFSRFAEGKANTLFPLFLSAFKDGSSHNALVGMIGQKVYCDPASNACFTYMDWNKRLLCER